MILIMRTILRGIKDRNYGFGSLENSGVLAEIKSKEYFTLKSG